MFNCCVSAQPATVEVVHVPAAHLKENGLNGAASPPEAPARNQEMPAVHSKFEVQLQKNESKLGLHLDLTGSGVQVVKIVAGGVEDYNRSVPSGKQILAHDFITVVNGVSTSADMIKKMRDDPHLTLTIVKPTRFTVKMDKAGKKLGLNLAFQEATSSCIEVKEVIDGAIEEYNATAAPALRVMKNDFLESVNGASGTAKKILQEIKAANQLEIGLLRVPV